MFVKLYMLYMHKNANSFLIYFYLKVYIEDRASDFVKGELQNMWVNRRLFGHEQSWKNN
jgi:hypothetical protein